MVRFNQHIEPRRFGQERMRVRPTLTRMHPLKLLSSRLLRTSMRPRGIPRPAAALRPKFKL